MTLGNVVLRLSDTAGIRNTDNKVEKIGVEKAIQRLKTCGLLLAVFDSSMPLEKEDYKLIEDIKNVPSVAVINKSDLEKKIDSDYIEKNTENVVYISAGNASGLQELESVIEKITGTNSFDPSQGVLSNERQRNSAFLAKKALEEAKNALEIGMTFDAVTISIEEAISELLELTGENVSDEIVDKVFHNFCVGK